MEREGAFFTPRLSGFVPLSSDGTLWPRAAQWRLRL